MSAINGNSREYWEMRADALRKRDDMGIGWRVGRTDMYGYDANGEYVHYAYPPEGSALDRIAFNGGVMGALRKAVLHAEKMNQKIDRSFNNIVSRLST